MKRKDVYKAIDTERDYQNGLTDRVFTVGDEILIAQKYLNKASDEWLIDWNQPEEKALEQVRKVAGVLVRCLENHGVKGRD